MLILIGLGASLRGTAADDFTVRDGNSVAGQRPVKSIVSLIEPSSSGERVVTAEVIQANMARTDIVFIDVRSQEMFRMAHIPGSINLPLFTLKTKGFLKAKPLVLVNEGHNDEDLLQEARRLREVQFSYIRVLAGGLRVWQQAGGRLEGERVGSAGWAELSPTQFHLAHGSGAWLLVDTRPQRASNGPSWLPATNIVFDPGSFAARLTGALRVNPYARRVLLFNANGAEYDQIEAVVSGVRTVPIFYLAGGLEEYGQFLRRQIAMQNRRTVTQADQSMVRFSNASQPVSKVGGCCGAK